MLNDEKCAIIGKWPQTDLVLLFRSQIMSNQNQYEQELIQHPQSHVVRQKIEISRKETEKKITVRDR